MSGPYRSCTSRSRRWLLITVGMVGLTTASAGTWVTLSTSPDAHAPSPRPAVIASNASASPTEMNVAGQAALPAVTTTSDPETFARSVAVSLFDWDTTSGHGVADYSGRLVAISDPSGVEAPSLVGDIANYLPEESVWSDLSRFRTRQHLEIESADVPTEWKQAYADGDLSDQLPGTTAYTIGGIRHRAGVWHDEQVTTQHDVVLTIFVVCAPTYANCHLLRLSRPGQALR